MLTLLTEKCFHHVLLWKNFLRLLFNFVFSFFVFVCLDLALESNPSDHARASTIFLSKSQTDGEYQQWFCGVFFPIYSHSDYYFPLSVHCIGIFYWQKQHLACRIGCTGHWGTWHLYFFLSHPDLVIKIKDHFKILLQKHEWCVPWFTFIWFWDCDRVSLCNRGLLLRKISSPF